MHSFNCKKTKNLSCEKSKKGSPQAGKFPKIKISPLAFVFVGLLFIDGTLFALIAFVAALLHELAHLAVAVASGIPVKEFAIYPLGAVIVLGSPCPYRADIAVKLAGGAANLCAALICGIIRIYLKDSGVGTADAMLFYFMICNIALAFFNLLPIRTLDGGEALYSALCLFHEPDKASRIVRIASVCALVPLWIVSSYVLFYTGCNFSLLLICGWLFFSAVMQCK